MLPYIIRGGELFVDRRSKSITISTVAAALQKIVCYGAGYLYPMF